MLESLFGLLKKEKKTQLDDYGLPIRASAAHGDNTENTLIHA